MLDRETCMVIIDRIPQDMGNDTPGGTPTDYNHFHINAAERAASRLQFLPSTEG